MTQTFNDATRQAIGSSAIDLNAPGGLTDTGTIYLVYDTLSCDITDPNCDPTPAAFSQLLSAPASVKIVSATVPEPGRAGLMLTGAALLIAGLRKAAGSLAV